MSFEMNVSNLLHATILRRACGCFEPVNYGAPLRSDQLNYESSQPLPMTTRAKWLQFPCQNGFARLAVSL